VKRNDTNHRCSYLLTYDSLQFHAYLETLIAANTVSVHGGVKQHQSPWMLTDAANIIFQSAKRRCYTVSQTTKTPVVVDLTEDDDAWDALNEAEGHGPATEAQKGEEKRPKWLPDGLEPVLEELPKWNLLAEVLLEAEGEIIRQESLKKPGAARESHNSTVRSWLTCSIASGSTNTVLVMTSSTRTCSLLTEFLSTMDDNIAPGMRGRKMMMRKLKLYLWWKAQLAERKQDRKSYFGLPDGPNRAKDGFDKIYRDDVDGMSEALKKKDKERAERAQSRRRVRGGGPSTGGDRAAVPVIPKPEPKEYNLREIQNRDGLTRLCVLTSARFQLV